MSALLSELAGLWSSFSRGAFIASLLIRAPFLWPHNLPRSGKTLGPTCGFTPSTTRA